LPFDTAGRAAFTGQRSLGSDRAEAQPRPAAVRRRRGGSRIRPARTVCRTTPDRASR